MKKTITGSFTITPDLLLQADFNAIQILILSRILSWQRSNKPFYESEVVLSKLFGENRRKIRKALADLVDKGVIQKKADKVCRTFEYICDEGNLKYYIRAYKSSCVGPTQDLCNTYTGSCSAPTQDPVQGLHTIIINNNNKNNNTEEEPLLGGSSSGPILNISDEELKAFIEDLDI